MCRRVAFCIILVLWEKLHFSWCFTCSPAVGTNLLASPPRILQQLQQHHHKTKSHPQLFLATVNEVTASCFEFTTQPMQVYIEDTDAYGIMYNSNYLRCYDRALHMTSYAQTKSPCDNGNSYHDDDDEQLNGEDDDDALPSILKHDDEWSLVSFERMKFKQSPALGQSFVVTGRLVGEPSDSEQIWDLEMKDAVDDSSIVFNTIQGVRIAHAPTNSRDFSWIPNPGPLATEDRERQQQQYPTLLLEQDFQVYRDEFDPHLQGYLPLRNVLNLFERIRSNSLGGPNALRRLQQEDGFVYVVTSIDQCSLVDYNNSVGSNTSMLQAGDSLRVRFDAIMKRQGALIEFRQTAFLGNARVAQAVVTIMALSEQTRRPSKRLPQWMVDQMMSICNE